MALDLVERLNLNVGEDKFSRVLPVCCAAPVATRPMLSRRLAWPPTPAPKLSPLLAVRHESLDTHLGRLAGAYSNPCVLLVYASLSGQQWVCYHVRRFLGPKAPC